jgi:16S rRNA processing protein RimM
LRNLEDEPAPVAGRADPGMKIAVGRVLRPHGVKGEVKFDPFFDDIPEILEGTAVELIMEKGPAAPIIATALHFRGAGQTLIAKFDGFDDPESARSLTNRVAVVERRLMPDLPEGNYYYEEIIGLPVFGEDGVKIGSLRDFFPAGEKDVWEIETVSGGEILLPCLPETVLNVDLTRGVITVKLMETIL